MKKLSLAILDDDEDAKALFYMDAWGLKETFDIMGVAAGYEELVLLTQHQLPDIILCDWCIGPQFASQILSAYFGFLGTRTSVVVMSSAGGLPDKERQQLNDLGVRGYITKPSSGNDYLLLASQLLECCSNIP